MTFESKFANEISYWANDRKDALFAFIDNDPSLLKDDTTEVLRRFEDCYYGYYEQDRDFGYDLAHESGVFEKASKTAREYFNYSQYASDMLTCDYYKTSSNHVFRN